MADLPPTTPEVPPEVLPPGDIWGFKNPSTNPNHVLFFHCPDVSDEVELKFNDIDAIKKSNSINVEKSTKVLIHGFQSNRKQTFPQNVKDAFLTNTHVYEHNVIIVDWGKLAGPLTVDYWNVASNLKITGCRIAEFLLRLNDEIGLDLTKVHLIGHSLGAHIAGWVGATIRDKGKKLGRISALDPAGPSFKNLFKDVKGYCRVGSNDAEFVDAYHTNAGGLGASFAVGDVDFFINGGVKQPKCSFELKPGYMNACSHSKSHEMYAETISNGPRSNKAILTITRCGDDSTDSVDTCEKSSWVFGEYCDPSLTGTYDVKYNYGG